MRSLIFAILIWFLQSDLQAQEVRIKFEDCQVSSEVYYELKHALTFQKQFYQELMGKQKLDTMQARIFADEKAFRKFSKNERDYNPGHNTLAYYDPDVNEMVLHLQANDFVTTFKHELSHAMMAQYCEDGMYDWLDEGIAEYLEDIVFVDSIYALNNNYIRKIRDAKFLMKTEFDLSDAVYTEDFDVAKNHYLTSWAAVVYLMDNAPDVLGYLLKNLSVSEFEVTEELYPGGLDLLETDTKSYFLNFSPQ